ncbi:valyl-tRNA synthetase, putative [Theileria equi strain WA]|uniref:valine--tRNA ligase n=1 Tax=Theileria equi strain WA TaxID=1537102 RepID=L0B259_THEEQ|nr:valyl-tRNA synthetase, putative [Theileria equi strain WA]AFZ81583.1 valyl-tRNA synthetase, putative [Theileria equi strain WA]|eukprot:XP_004831249.1 valyl-tRNA synthetase, putative [Theileria equi strain WA]
MSKTHINKTFKELESTYDPKAVEDSWYSWWEASGFFMPFDRNLHSDKNKWIALLPPPNVTGSLHIGHALTISIQDSLARWHRMKGDTTLWIPGTDHAGIATQTVVERTLYKTENKKRHDYTRKEFIGKVFEWNDKYGNNIKNQLRRMGASLDWTREAFTMDDKRSKAVVEAFVRLYDSGLVYRNTRLVSWCSFLSTALSDIEVEPFEVTSPTHIKLPGIETSVEVGVLWIFKYPVHDVPDKYISVATTRIETMLGDVAVAVNPDDERYKEFVGCRLTHPFFPERNMIVVADNHIDKEFGTGAVKITPSHDKNDFEIAKRHSLPFINIFTNDGKINENGGIFANMHRFECRKVIEKELKQLGLFEDKIPNTKPMMIPRCSRTGDIVEYMLIPQWYIDCKKLAKGAIDAVKDGSLRLFPSTYISVWNQWLENIQDWCVSRQLWWGHRIPAYKIISSNLNDEWIIARDPDEAHDRVKKKFPHLTTYQLEQDEDVLDTWFSSGLFPLSTLGWPNESAEDFIKFFPTTLLETGNDILFFWVARMVMLSIQLVGKLPFSEVYMHPLVRDSRGEKMSKSKGNVVDPIDIIDGTTLEKLNQNILNSSLPQGEIKKALLLQKQQFPDGIPPCGVDALRLGLLALTRHNRSILLDVNKLVCSRHFGNKIWNATKFAINRTKTFKVVMPKRNELMWEDIWILHKLNQYIKRVNNAFETYQFVEAVQASYDFWLYQLCDIYLELIKSRLPPSLDFPMEDLTPHMKASIYTIFECLSTSLRLLHPIMPYITEELYHHLPEHLITSESISLSKFPEEIPDWNDDSLDNDMTTIMSIVHGFRSLSNTLGLPPNAKRTGFVTISDDMFKVISDKTHLIKILSKFESISLVDKASEKLLTCVQNIISTTISAHIHVDDSVDLLKTSSVLGDRLSKTNKSLDSYIKKTTIPNYTEKVPETVRELNETKIRELSTEKMELERAISDIERLKINTN